MSRMVDYARTALALGPTPRAKWDIFYRQTKNVRVQLGLAHCNPRDVYRLETIYGPLHFRDNFGDITNLVGLYYRQVYRVARLQEPGVIFDVGANIGLAAAWFARHNPGRRIVCFEPLQANVEIIRLNCPDAEVQQAAVGAEPGTVTLQVDPDSVMASRIPMKWATVGRTFPVITLDAYSTEQGIQEVALIKIDAEGMEDDILRGAEQTLRRTHQVVLETHGLGLHQDVVGRLVRAGLMIDGDTFQGTTGTGMVYATRRPVGA